MIAVREAIENWEADPSKGRFRSWLAKIAQNAIINVLTRRPPDVAAGGTRHSRTSAAAARAGSSRAGESRTRVPPKPLPLGGAADSPEFRKGTWDAFWLTTVDGMRWRRPDARLGKPVGAIYAARSRVMRRLKDEIEQSGFVWRD